MTVKVKKPNLLYQGRRYDAGSVLEMTDEKLAEVLVMRGLVVEVDDVDVGTGEIDKSEAPIGDEDAETTLDGGAAEIPLAIPTIKKA